MLKREPVYGIRETKWRLSRERVWRMKACPKNDKSTVANKPSQVQEPARAMNYLNYTSNVRGPRFFWSARQLTGTPCQLAISTNSMFARQFGSLRRSGAGAVTIVVFEKTCVSNYFLAVLRRYIFEDVFLLYSAIINTKCGSEKEELVVLPYYM